MIVVEHDEDAILHGRLCGRRRPRRRHPWRRDRRRRARRPRSWPTRTRSPGKYLTGEHVRAGAAPSGASRRRAACCKIAGARGNNLKNVTAEIPLGHLHLRHRRVGRRQVDARHRHALQGRGAAAERRAGAPCPVRHDRGARASRQGHRHRPVADRPHAALEPGDLYRRLHADPRLVRRPAGGEGARLQAGPLLLQRQGRALRGLPGRRRHQDRDALPARRLRHLRRLQGQALQPRDAGGEVPRASPSPTCST